MMLAALIGHGCGYMAAVGTGAAGFIYTDHFGLTVVACVAV